MLPELNKYLEFINYKQNIKLEKLSLKGIWKGKGFEKINIEEEVKKLHTNSLKKLDSIKI